MRKTERMLLVRVRETPSGKFVTICDEEVVGREYHERGIVLSVSREFYEGDSMDESEVLEVLAAAKVVTAIGEKAVKLLIESRLVHPSSVVYVESVPFAMYVDTR